jgi:predicted NAD/FAD-binding protein
MSRIAVLGSGISGMATAYFLSRRHEVVLFEKDDRLGGHTHTHEIETPTGPLQIDTGFLVHNDRTYPNFVRLLSELGVQRQLSDMSFGVSHPDAGIEYSSRDLRGFFAQRRNIFSLRHYRFFLEILRFNRQARALLADPDGAELSLAEYLDRNRFSRDFTRYYLYPMASAVWSTSMDKVADFPALTLIRFFDNHDFLRVTTQFPWYTIAGGSRTYIAPLTAPYRDRVRLGVTITGVARTSRGVRIYAAGAEPEHFDEVVFACHAPQALGLLRDASGVERGRAAHRFQSVAAESRRARFLELSSRPRSGRGHAHISFEPVAKIARHRRLLRHVESHWRRPPRENSAAFNLRSSAFHAGSHSRAIAMAGNQRPASHTFLRCVLVLRLSRRWLKLRAARSPNPRSAPGRKGTRCIPRYTWGRCATAGLRRCATISRTRYSWCSWRLTGWRS